MSEHPSSHRLRAVAVMTVAVAAALVTAGLSGADPVTVQAPPEAECPPAATVQGYSDALDRAEVADGAIGGLSALDYDRRAELYVAPADHDRSGPHRLWFFSDPASPRPVRSLLLRHPDGAVYADEQADLEGLAVLPDGRYLISSELTPSIEIFGRDGVRQQRLSVPARFAVQPYGQGRENATLEGLTVSPDGTRVIAAMEGALTGDSDAADHRLLDYRWRNGRFTVVGQLGYRTDDRMRIPEVTLYDRNRLLIMESHWNPLTGNAIRLYASDLTAAADVAGTADLSRNQRAVLPKVLVAELVDCPDLGASARTPQTNPLLDNYEGLEVSPLGRSGGADRDRYAITLISDDNHLPVQRTRVLRLTAELP